jgi:hypothetical protein
MNNMALEQICERLDGIDDDILSIISRLERLENLGVWMIGDTAPANDPKMEPKNGQV